MNLHPTKPIRLVILLAAALLAAIAKSPADDFITVASTTSTEQSGLFRHLLPQFEEKTGIAVRVVALGSGQALHLARRGDADLVLAHSPEDEEKFVSEGFGVRRVSFMYNDFVLVGPTDDPAKTSGVSEILDAMMRIARTSATFVSRADQSGTHLAEQKLWSLAGIDIEKEKGPWYRESGQGMGQALNMASSMDAYLLADRGTWISFKNRGNLKILVQGKSELRNPYSAILANQERHPHVKAETAARFIDWLVSSEGQEAIASFRINGEQLFYPDAVPR